MSALTATQFNFPKQKSFYKGKVRDVYNIDDKYLVMIASDRISAFDVIMTNVGSLAHSHEINRIYIYVYIYTSTSLDFFRKFRPRANYSHP